MKIERLLQINLASLVVLGTIMVSLKDGDVGFPFIVTLSAIAALVFTDKLKWFRLNRLVANLIGVGAAFLCANSFILSPGFDQMNSIARFLIYLQLVLLFQEKRLGLYWYLAVLSLLQVVIAAAMNQSLVFGMTLAVYIVCAISALIIFYIYRETFLIARTGEKKLAAIAEPQPQETTLSRTESHPNLLGTAPVAYQDCSHIDLTQPLYRSRLFGQIAAFVFVSLVFSVVLFRLRPPTNSSGLGFGQVAVVGFSHTINLMNRMNIQENNQPVMRVTFFAGDTSEKFTPQKMPYFQGAVVTDYSWTKKTWPDKSQGFERDNRLTRPPRGTAWVKQKIELLPSDDTTLFGVFPTYAVGSNPGLIRLRKNSESLVLPANNPVDRKRLFSYVLATTALRGKNSEEKAIPYLSPPDSNDNQLPKVWNTTLSKDEKKALVDFDPDIIPTAKKIADDIVAGLPEGKNGLVKKIRALEAYFVPNNKDFSYTLELANIRQQDEDPIEDFLAHNKKGHCEFFASALTMMLRSQGIPARMVIGYKGEYNTVGKYYNVRQSGAHAWVEAYIPPEQAKQLLGENHPDNTGAWMRLDPTPNDNSSGPSGLEKSWWEKTGDTFQYAQLLWGQYVLGNNSEQEKDQMQFDPYANPATLSLNNFFTWQAWKEYFQNLITSLGLDFSNWTLRDVFSWRGGLLAIFACLLLVGGYQMVILLIRLYLRASQRGQTGLARRRVTIRVEFYESLAALLTRHGMVRDVGQTQREHAASAAGHLSDSTISYQIAHLPKLITTLFYRVRFGGDTLDKGEQDKIEQSLTEIETALAEHRSSEEHTRE